jgi:hypothetical protein
MKGLEHKNIIIMSDVHEELVEALPVALPPNFWVVHVGKANDRNGDSVKPALAEEDLDWPLSSSRHIVHHLHRFVQRVQRDF